MNPKYYGLKPFLWSTRVITWLTFLKNEKKKICEKNLTHLFCRFFPDENFLLLNLSHIPFDRIWFVCSTQR